MARNAVRSNGCKSSSGADSDSLARSAGLSFGLSGGVFGMGDDERIRSSHYLN
jgi:hypothetical protein